MRYHKCGKKVLELSLVSKIERKIVEARTRKAFLEKAVPLFQKELENARFDITGCATVSSMNDPESWGTRSDRKTSRNIWRQPDKGETNNAVEDENKDEKKDDDKDDAINNDVENKEFDVPTENIVYNGSMTLVLVGLEKKNKEAVTI